MIAVGIDVAMDSHTCAILGEGGEELVPVFCFNNDLDGFELLMERIAAVADDPAEVRAGLEATGHYSDDLLGYLREKGLSTTVINPLHTSLYRKGLSLKKTKTDKADARAIAQMLLAGVAPEPSSAPSYHISELKSLTRYRFSKVQERARLRTSLTRLVTLLFPELRKLVPKLHMKSIYALLSEFPSAIDIASAPIEHLAELLSSASRGRYGIDKAEKIKLAAIRSIGRKSSAQRLELKHTIGLIDGLSAQVREIEAEIKQIMAAIDSPIVTIPGIKLRMGAMILAEIGDFGRFSSPDKIMKYAGMAPSVYESGKFKATNVHMDKRGSRYLRYALFNAAWYVCLADPKFKAHYDKKRAEGKHHFVAVSHVAKKLIRVMFHLAQTGESYVRQPV